MYSKEKMRVYLTSSTPRGRLPIYSFIKNIFIKKSAAPTPELSEFDEKFFTLVKNGLVSVTDYEKTRLLYYLYH